MREIVLDTETTGMDPEAGDRLVEIGCIELENHVPTGRFYHQYINPERDVPSEAVAVHGLTNEKLKNEPVFSQIYTDFLDFIGDAQLVIHNAAFDMKFLNYQLQLVGHKPMPMTRATDTLMMARKKFPGSPANLDALCRRFGIDNSSRTFHGALLDSELLAEVYLELLGGRQHGLGLGSDNRGSEEIISHMAKRIRVKRDPRPHEASSAELEKHKELIGQMKDAIWGWADKDK
jgi:DNA polymerase-3 subunit epsilon